MRSPTITVDMSQECPRCGKLGAANGGMCLRCMIKAIETGEFDDVLRRRPPTSPAQATPSASPRELGQAADSAGKENGDEWVQHKDMGQP